MGTPEQNGWDGMTRGGSKKRAYQWEIMQK
jgi:hypothetical protein